MKTTGLAASAEALNMSLGDWQMARIVAMVIWLVLAGPGMAASIDIGGYTNMTFDSGHGTQVEYVAAGGISFLWYPGNRVVLDGRWKRQGSDICFLYGANTYNPVTGVRGGAWECMPFRLYWGGITERMKGDIFALRGRGAVPFVLSKDRTTLERLLSHASPGAKPPAPETPVNAPAGEIAETCDSIMANAGRSKWDMTMAASTYFYGMFMGKPCGKVDYDRAFALARQAGISVGPWLNVLRERAASGNPLAISALKRLGS
jgi:hypothetical protein